MRIYLDKTSKNVAYAGGAAALGSYFFKPYQTGLIILAALAGGFVLLRSAYLMWGKVGVIAVVVLLGILYFVIK